MFLFQVIYLFIIIFDWKSIENKIEEDRENLSKRQLKRVWVGRVFMLFLPSLIAISAIYNPI